MYPQKNIHMQHYYILHRRQYLKRQQMYLLLQIGLQFYLYKIQLQQHSLLVVIKNHL